jgi:hypothetical protein
MRASIHLLFFDSFFVARLVVTFVARLVVTLRVEAGVFSCADRQRGVVEVVVLLVVFF